MYLSENGDADVLTAGLVDQRVQLLRWKWAGERKTLWVPLWSLLLSNLCVFDLHGDDSLPGLRRQAYGQLFVMGDQVCAGLRNVRTHND